jgi:uncharacterized protein
LFQIGTIGVKVQPENALPTPSPGERFEVRVTPKAARNEVRGLENGRIAVSVTTVPEGGKANAEVLKLLAKALGVPKSRLRIVRGETGRSKLIAYDP